MSNSYKTPPHKNFDDLEKLAHLMDSQFTITGTNIKFGLDALIGIIPIIGDTLMLYTNIYILIRARSFDIPWHGYVRMFGNIIIDWLIGLPPIIGDVFDVGFKSHIRNINIIKKYTQKP
jgi:hypothetical protein